MPFFYLKTKNSRIAFNSWTHVLFYTWSNGRLLEEAQKERQWPPIEHYVRFQRRYLRERKGTKTKKKGGGEFRCWWFFHLFFFFCFVFWNAFRALLFFTWHMLTQSFILFKEDARQSSLTEFWRLHKRKKTLWVPFHFPRRHFNYVERRGCLCHDDDNPFLCLIFIFSSSSTRKVELMYSSCCCSCCWLIPLG